MSEDGANCFRAWCFWLACVCRKAWENRSSQDEDFKVDEAMSVLDVDLEKEAKDVRGMWVLVALHFVYRACLASCTTSCSQQSKWFNRGLTRQLLRAFGLFR